VLRQGLASLKDRYPDLIEDIRGIGLLLGIKCAKSNADLVAAMRNEHLLAVPAGDNVVRLLPPLIVTVEEVTRSARKNRGRARNAVPQIQLTKRTGFMTKTPAASTRHFLDLSAVSAEELRAMIDAARSAKTATEADRPLAGKMLAMIFEKPSTRTRVSFDVGMRQLGGETLFLSGTEMQLGRAETIADTAKVLSRYVDIIMIRTLDHERMLELAEHATVPVINALTDDTHPCQIMADILTFEEHRGPIKGKTLAWTGDGNNVLHSLIEGAAQFGYRMQIATPEGSEPETSSSSGPASRARKSTSGQCRS
jgi:hypothetical protein